MIIFLTYSLCVEASTQEESHLKERQRTPQQAGLIEDVLNACRRQQRARQNCPVFTQRKKNRISVGMPGAGG